MRDLLCISLNGIQGCMFVNEIANKSNVFFMAFLIGSFKSKRPKIPSEQGESDIKSPTNLKNLKCVVMCCLSRIKRLIDYTYK